MTPYTVGIYKIRILHEHEARFVSCRQRVLYLTSGADASDSCNCYGCIRSCNTHNCIKTHQQCNRTLVMDIIIVCSSATSSEGGRGTHGITTTVQTPAMVHPIRCASHWRVRPSRKVDWSTPSVLSDGQSPMLVEDEC